MRPRRHTVLLIGLALVVAACGGGEAEVASSAETSSTTQSDATATTSVPSTEPTAPPATGQTTDADTSADERPAPDPNRTIAPDFSLALGDGSTFVLSEETRPVFMVFWAEW